MSIRYFNSDDVLDRQKVIVALEEKRTQFESYAGELRSQRDIVATRLAILQALTYQELNAFLDELGDTPKGALPTEEWDKAQGFCLPFGREWATHEEAREWAKDVLLRRPVAAVDGSQIVPSKDFNIPVGAIQIGWYINHHEAGVPYVKDVAFSVISPNEFDDSVDEITDEQSMSAARVNQQRFIGECDQLCKIMEDYRNAPQESKPLCFFDGSLIVSFANQLNPGIAEEYLVSVRKLIDISSSTKVPLVAFIDHSVSHDFTTLVDTVSGTNRRSEKLNLSDAGALSRYLPKWGDRLPMFLCDREDNFRRRREYDPTLYNNVAFTYMRLTRDRVPARIEMPHWIVEEGKVDDVLNLVRAECIIGGGYPYAIETADALAVISHADRERFYGLFEQFAQQSGLTLVQARKLASKLARR